ncbi:RluA family pseudouridine synthase [Atopobacter phocae]|uniref:RluA family pseudouridine synthase n=1 Tax=Atopobacter phocae TaxID=136492 RepID=UPI00047031A3|nr:RluA family pseudouridine synthase [Atopobacter phocae]
MTNTQLTKTWTIDKDTIRIDKWLTIELPEISRSHIQKLIDLHLIRVNGEATNNRYKLKQGDIIEMYEMAEEEPLLVEPENIPLDIVYEDDSLLVIYKEPGMVVHPSKGHNTGTLVHALMYHSKELSSVGEAYRPGIVHRIDKDTSGLLVVAKNNQVHRQLQEQIQQKVAKRKYIALVDGVVRPQAGKIDAPLGRDPKNRLRRKVIKTGKEAITNFIVKERYEKYTLLELELETGRTHQIRAHMYYIGHPIINDPMYYNLHHKVAVPGQMLHAYSLSFIHPVTKEPLHFERDLSPAFKESLEYLTRKGRKG